ncbi:polysaccharide pyruvyl transferase family protein [Myroides odoratimimus]|uniref:polysaccharide pyruvyl transferase family protein n=1 Tax=Myroides odoratimimus TaxID=76832 RepID=UPI00103A9839|nr:polysaccharide pyruvyl transferase family protein [Myroides odoratimimus]QBK77623.1 polysaccharide pyruvyl transferase family protein [Myroides odoratimimus]WHT73070.1 polysaccharide pyruvyl transferase family protein [Myroides odoratimimus]WHU37653.1 polysaccharide pyruvyl transferase family protein [Myroides odoratimimus]
MKKTGIFTHPLISNYGGILQNFALQKVLEKNGYEVITINRLQKFSMFHILLSRLKQSLLKHHTNKIFSPKEKDVLTLNSQAFVKNNIKKVDFINPTDKDLLTYVNNHNINTLIVGSDQVWRPGYVSNIYHEFFSFLPNESNVKRVSYAASFGTDKCEYTEEQLARCSKLLSQFDAVSVREKSGIELCSNYLKRDDAQVVLDPTLLLEKEDYLTVVKNQLVEKKGVYTYVLDSSAEKNKIIDTVCSQLNLEKFSNQPKFSEIGGKGKSNNLKDYAFPPIEDWIEGFYKSSFVVTDSFHGTVFAIIFNKPFIAIANVERGKARFESLLKLFGLENRLVSTVNEISTDLISEEIDFEAVNSKREALKKISIDFLINNI